MSGFFFAPGLKYRHISTSYTRPDGERLALYAAGTGPLPDIPFAVPANFSALDGSFGDIDNAGDAELRATRDGSPPTAYVGPEFLTEESKSRLE